MKSERQSITPEMRVAEFLLEFPELENALLDLSPSFAKLRNPILRRTVAKVTTLAQAAKVGGVPVAQMVNSLRTAAGQKALSIPEGPTGQTGTTPPSWFESEEVRDRVDIRPALERGEKPLGLVLGRLESIRKSGGILLVTAPLLPAPLIELAEKKGFQSWAREEPGSLFQIYFRHSSWNRDSDLIDLG